MKVSIYGAGKIAKKYLPSLMQEYDIEVILDIDENKHGLKLCDIPIIAPNEISVNNYPVIITLYDINSALATLKKYQCRTQIYKIVEFMGGYGIVEHECKKQKLTEIIKQGRWFRDKHGDFFQAPVYEGNQGYDPLLPRFFNIASPLDFDAAGGPCACLRNLWLANEKYKLIKNFFTICPSVAYIPKGYKTNRDDSVCYPEELPYDIIKEFEETTDEITDSRIRQYQFMLLIWEFLDKANSLFRFNENDIFLLQDPFVVEVFISRFPAFNKLIHAYHVQGSLKNETKVKTPELGEVYDCIQLKHIQKIKHWIFPSRGAADNFLSTSNQIIQQLAQNNDFHVAHNGYEVKEQLYPDSEFATFLSTIDKNRMVFVSATFLYYNKGVELIPKILKRIKEMTGVSLLWILVGNGEMEKEVEENIKQYLEEADYIWYRNRFDNQDNIFALFSRADFYIMMHRVSVFDLSTLQSMAYGCIPVLSDIGGNLELCGFNNGILINPNEGRMDFIRYIENRSWVNEKKALNINVVKEHFDNYSFLKSYNSVLEILRYTK